VLGTGNAVATATNMDGSIIVGWDFIWNLRTQSVTRLGDLPGALPQSFAYAVSDDGLVVAGRSQNGAFVWDARNGMRDLSFSIGDFGSYFYALSALGLSSDGSVVVGSGPRNATMTEAFRWTESGGMQELGFLTGQSGYSQAQAVSADGSIVVGSSSTFESNSGRVAFIWDAEHGMRPLNVVLAELGVDTDGWSLDIAMDISADGTRIVGSGKNPAGATEAFLIVIPEPSTMCFLALGLVWLAGARRPHSGFGRAQFVSSIREGSQRSRVRLRSTAN
jgi:uncharacterized membrane protein